MKLLRLLASVHFWVSLLAVSAVIVLSGAVVRIFTFPFDPRRRVLHRMACLWADTLLVLNPWWKATITGLDRIVPGTVYIIVANHQSGLDIILLFKLRILFRWVAKQELFSFPFIGWGMRLCGYIPLERSRGRSQLRMMGSASEALAEGDSVILFPEGTRSPDGNLQPYKSGAFRLAIETQMPILPVAISGTTHAIRKNGLTVHRNRTIRMEVLDPIPFEAFREMDPKAIAGMVNNLTERALQ